MKPGQVAGVLMIVGGALTVVIGLAVLALFAKSAGLNAAGFGVGIIFLMIIALPLGGAGIFLFVKAGQEGKEEETAARQRKILEMVATRGELRISDAAIELKATRDQIQSWVYNLVGLGLFSGYINWGDGVLYSAQAAQLKGLETCKKCGGKVSLAGKGVIKCQYCGTEYFV